MAMLMLSCGCVPPGPIDPGMVARYQRAMLLAGPQDRDRLGPLSQLLPPASEIGPRLTLTVDEETGAGRVELSLDEAVLIALANNIDIRVVSYSPGISRQEVIQAAAAFDYVTFASYSLVRQDLRINFFGTRNLRTNEFQAGVRQTTVTGAEVALTNTLTWVRDHSFSRTSPNFEPDMTLSLTQPLLRGGGRERNLASLRIARINNKVDNVAFRQQVEQTVTDVITTYWLLVQARLDLAIQQDLLDKTDVTYQRVLQRRFRDAAAVEIKQSEAAVETRRAALIRAHKNIVDVQDALGRLLSDETINSVANVEIIPTTPLSTELVALDVTDQLVTALEHSPVLAQARLAIQAADISVRVARNEQLPKLDFVGSVGLTSGGTTLHEAKARQWNGDFFNYEVGFQMEYPIGNRQRKAQLRQRQYERLQATAQLQRTADDVAIEVREQIRQIGAAHKEILAQQKAVAANFDQLQALEDTERIRGELTPEFLRVKLGAQESLAAARRAELQSIIDYNVALVELDQVTGAVLALRRVQMAMPMIFKKVSWDSPTWPSDLPAEDGLDESPPPADDGDADDQPYPDVPSEIDDTPTPINTPQEQDDAPVQAVIPVYPDGTVDAGDEIIDGLRRLSSGARQFLQRHVASR